MHHRPIWSASLLALAVLLTPAPGAEDPFAALRTYEPGQGQAPLVIPRETAFHATPAQRAAVEAALVALLRDPATTPAGRREACHLLVPVASPACLDAVAPLLSDPQVTVTAREVVQALPDGIALPALRSALARAEGRTRAGLAADAGRRHDRASIPALVALAGDADAGVANAAITALRDAGAGPELAALPVQAATSNARWDALVAVASDCAAHGDGAAALALVQPLTTGTPIAIRCAAWQVAAAADTPGTLATVIPLLADADAHLATAIAGLLVALPDPRTGGHLAQALATLPADGQIRALEVLARRRDGSAATAVAACAAPGGSAALRIAALHTLGTIGGPDQLDGMLGATQDGDAAIAGAAREALAACPHPGLPAAIASRLGSATGTQRDELAIAGANRQVPAAIAAIIPLAAGEGHAADGARTTLARVAGAEHLDALAALITTSTGAEAVERLWVDLIKRLPDHATAARPLLALVATSQGPVRTSCLRLLGLTGSAAALAMVVQDTTATDAATVDAAVRVLAGWPDIDAVPHLLALATTSGNQTHRTLAMRGVARLADLPGRSVEQNLAVLRQAYAAVKRPEDRKLLLGAAGRIPSLATLDLLAPALGDGLVQEEAVAAWLAVARALAASKQQAQAAQALDRLIAATSGPLQVRARQEQAQLHAKGSK